MSTSRLLNTDTEDLQDLLSNGKRYSVPQFQRDYSWQQEQWEELWDDLIAAETSKQDHYMGALVLQVREDKEFLIVDGQQRLATLSILILACRAFLRRKQHGTREAHESEERAKLLETSYIGSTDAVSLRVVSKVTLNRTDNSFYQLNLVNAKPPVSERALNDSEKLMWRAFKFFSACISEKFAEDFSGISCAQFVQEVVARRLIFISVRVEDQLSAYTVFETLNARGLELTETDLLKNYLLSLASGLSESQQEHMLMLWQRISNTVGLSRFPEFLRHHMNARQAFIRQKDLFKTIKRDVQGLEQVYLLLEQLEVDSVWYEAVLDHQNPFWLDYPGSKEYVRILNLFRVTQFIPLLLAAKGRFNSQEDVVKVLRYCAVISFRFNGISRRSTHALESAYNRAALAIHTGQLRNIEAILPLLKEIYIQDQDFTDDFATLRMENSGSTGKRLRYILCQIEKQKAGGDISDEITEATLEHILPQTYAEPWEASFSPEQHERFVTRLGNYTLLERKLNKEAGDKPFREKQKIYERSNYLLSRSLLECGDWNPETIEIRQRQLAKLAKGIWRIQELSDS